MDNKLIEEEAMRITDELININKSNKSLDNLFSNLIDDKYKKYDIKVLYHIPYLLAEKNYIIKSFNPFELEKK